MTKKRVEKKVLVNIRVSISERDRMKRVADKTQGGNVSRYLVYLHRERANQLGVK